MNTLIRFGLRLKLILSKVTHAKTTAVLDWNKHFLAFAVEGTRIMSSTPKMGFTQNPRTIKSVFGANAHAFNQGCEKAAMTLIARSQFITRLVATLLLVAGLTSMPAQAAQGSTVFIPIAVGDITTFIPIMPTASAAQISTTGGSHNLSWSAVSNASYYQIIITDEHGLQRIFQTTDTYYALAGLSLGNNKVEVQACNAYNQCGIRYLAGTVTITTRVIYQHTDMLGSVVAESDEAGNITSRSHYEPFGKRLGGDKAGIGYTGHLQDKDLGLTYMQARYYDPVIGRFYSNDPVGYTAKNPVMSFNRYLYVNNNPYKYTDPDGKVLNLATGVIGALIGGVSGAVSARISTGDWSNSGASFAVGAAVGGAVGLTFGAAAVYAAPLSTAALEATSMSSLVAASATGALANGAGDALGQVVSTGGIENVGSVVSSTVLGAATGPWSTLAKAGNMGKIAQAAIPATMNTMATPIKDSGAETINKAIQTDDKDQ